MWGDIIISVMFDPLQTCNLMDCSLPGSSVFGILQGIIVEWVAVPSSRGIFPIQELNPYLLQLPHCRQILYSWATGEAPYVCVCVCVYTHILIYIYGEINKMVPVRVFCRLFFEQWFTQLCNSWGHLQHCACTSQGTCLLQATLCGIPVWTSPWQPWWLLGWSDNMAMLYEVMVWLHCCYIMVMLQLLIRLLCQAGERLYYVCCAS